jgi:hypothetical protein
VLAARRVRRLTGISLEDWRELSDRFPELTPDPGRLAARSRARLARLAARSLASGRWPAELDGDPPGESPTVYVSAHIGSLQALRYCLRARGVAAATLLGPFNLERSAAERQDRAFDRRHPIAFPHFFPAASVHRLRTALRSGSLIAAADLPARAGIEEPVLGGRVRLDPRPFRLARAAGAACRPAFLTLPGGRWTLTLGERLPEDEDEAVRAFAAVYRRVASAAPADLDGVVYLHLARGARA